MRRQALSEWQSCREAFTEWRSHYGQPDSWEAWKEATRRSDVRLSTVEAAHTTQVKLLTKHTEELEADNARLQAHVADLQSGRYVNCV